jgi:hypothetical protein
MSRSQYAPKIIVLEQLPLFALLCKQSEDPPSELNGYRNHIRIFGWNAAGTDGRLQGKPPGALFWVFYYKQAPFALAISDNEFAVDAPQFQQPRP